MSSKYIIAWFYDGDITVDIYDTYQDVVSHLNDVGYDEDQVNEILIGDTWYDVNNYDFVKVQRVDV